MDSVYQFDLSYHLVCIAKIFNLVFIGRLPSLILDLRLSNIQNRVPN